MTEVLKALQELNVYWKKIGHYNMKCRWSRHIPGQNDTMLNLNNGFGEEAGIIENDDCGEDNLQNVVKFEIQVSPPPPLFLYKTCFKYKLEKDQKKKKIRCYIVWPVIGF
jgi:hypothetical protein